MEYVFEERAGVGSPKPEVRLFLSLSTEAPPLG